MPIKKTKIKATDIKTKTPMSFAEAIAMHKRCGTYKARPSSCQYCKQKIIFWQCTCGAKVMFDPQEEGFDGSRHIDTCPSPANPYQTK